MPLHVSPPPLALHQSINHLYLAIASLEPTYPPFLISRDLTNGEIHHHPDPLTHRADWSVSHT